MPSVANAAAGRREPATAATLAKSDLRDMAGTDVFADQRIGNNEKVRVR